MHSVCRLFLLLSLATLGACAPKGADSVPDVTSAQEPMSGGSAIVLLDGAFAGSWPAGLDPATNPNGGANVNMMNAIFGGLFQLYADDDGSNARIEGVLAESYEISRDGRQVTIRLREGVVFSDGTPFDSSAVKFNIERALASDCVCSPASWPWAEKTPVSTLDDLTIALHFREPYGPVINAIPASNLNWIVSPSALQAAGEDAFKIMPVGAGPFQIVSNKLGAELVLERNPRWFQNGRPYLDRLSFRSIGGDQAAYQALLAGDADAYVGMSSPLLLGEAEKNKKLTVTLQPATSVGVIQLNAKHKPFDDQRAREAIYYATDVGAISKGLFHGRDHLSQSFTAKGGMFFHDTVEGYRTYHPEKARALVKQMGGLKVTLSTLRSPMAEQILTALQTQWQAAGIETRIETHDIGTLIESLTSGSWQSMLQFAGSFDPDVGSGLRFRFGSTSPFSGVSDPTLDQMMHAAIGTVDMAQREELYRDISRYLSDKAYAPFLNASSRAQVTTRLRGPGLTTGIPPLLSDTGILWQDAWLAAR